MRNPNKMENRVVEDQERDRGLTFSTGLSWVFRVHPTSRPANPVPDTGSGTKGGSPYLYGGVGSR